jgi:hypothetical protein
MEQCYFINWPAGDAIIASLQLWEIFNNHRLNQFCLQQITFALQPISVFPDGQPTLELRKNDR